MFKKINSTILFAVLIVLAAILLFNKFYWNKRSENTFNDEFATIDSAKVNQIIMHPKSDKGKEIKLTKTDKGWMVQSGTVKGAADTALIYRLLSSFREIKSNAMVAADKSGWNEYEVNDSLGSRIQLMTSDNQKYDFMVGKFGFNSSSRSGTTYIRKTEEQAVHAISGTLTFTVNQQLNGWRNKHLVSGNKDKWSKLTFTYPADSSFVLEKTGTGWTLNGQMVDSNKTNEYLRQLETMQGNTFVDRYSPTAAPVYSLRIEGGKATGALNLTAYTADSVQRFVLHSDANADAWFSDGGSRLTERIFPGRQSFLP